MKRTNLKELEQQQQQQLDAEVEMLEAWALALRKIVDGRRPRLDLI